jgi:putative nucleotidyltransferase with HDIG domain
MPSTATLPATPPSAARNLLARMREYRLIDHAVRVSALAAEVSRRLGLGERSVNVVSRAALLHDVGKLELPQTLLERRRALTRPEWARMRTHPVAGERILRLIPGLEGLAPLVRHSHERVDGRGYPDGLRGDRIPLGSRIIAACDAWDAMTNDRPYRAAMASEDALYALEEAAGTHFDLLVVETLVAVLAPR